MVNDKIVNIEMVDLKNQYNKIKPEIDAAIQQVIESSAFIKGQKLFDFEQNLAQYLSVKHVIGVGNGTDALQIALMSLGLEQGSEIITPAFTFVATAEVIALLGFKPVFADVDKDSFCITTQTIEKLITPQTRAIVPVHLFGQNADMEPILQLAKAHNLYVIEDACQSIGAEYTFSDGKKMRSGCMGDVGCTSFFPSKNLGCYGDGGAIFTDNDKLAAKMRILANHGMEQRYHYDMIGVNSRLDTMQAAILNVKLKYLDEYIAARNIAAEYYDKAFSDCEKIKIPVRSKNSSHVFHQYTIQLQGINRDELQKQLAKKSIPTMIYYPIPLHLQKAYEAYRGEHLPVSEQLSKTVLSLPMHTELEEEQLEFITKNILDWVR